MLEREPWPPAVATSACITAQHSKKSMSLPYHPKVFLAAAIPRASLVDLVYLAKLKMLFEMQQHEMQAFPHIDFLSPQSRQLFMQNAPYDAMKSYTESAHA